MLCERIGNRSLRRCPQQMVRADSGCTGNAGLAKIGDRTPNVRGDQELSGEADTQRHAARRSQKTVRGVLPGMRRQRAKVVQVAVSHGLSVVGARCSERAAPEAHTERLGLVESCSP